MAASNSEPVQPDRSGRPWNIGTAILVILSGLMAVPRRAPGKEGAEYTGYFIGLIVGSFIGPVLLAVVIYAIVRRFNRDKPKSRSAKVTFWILFVWLLLVLLNLLGRAMNPRTASAQTVFSGEERQGLQISSDSIRHSSLGFALPNPGPTFVRFPLVEQQMAAEFGGKLPTDLIYWGMRDSTGGPILLIQVTGTPGLTESTFRDVLAGTRKGASRAKARVVSEEVTWNETRRESRVTIQHPNGLYVASRCVPSLKPGKEFIVCIQIFAQKPDDLSAVSNGLTVSK